MTSSNLFVIAVCAAALGAVAAGFAMMGTPGEARLRRLDNNRETGLREITAIIRNYQKSHKALPPDLAALNMRKKQVTDPVTDAPYAYKVTGADSYELCATFDTEPDEEQNNSYLDYGSCRVPLWKHPRGHYCYTVSLKDCQ